MSNPGTDHWHALERVMSYLNGTMSYGTHYSGHPVVFEGYCDSNWISDVDELYATSGYAFILGGGTVSWRSFQTDHFDEVNHGSRTCFRYSFC